MADISPAMIEAGLRKFGYAPTPENVQRAGAMLVSNPGMIDALMGLQGGAGGESGVNPSVMMSQLDKLAADGRPSGISVGNGNPNQTPLPQAPLPENTRGNSPAPVTNAVANPKGDVYPQPNEASGTPNNITTPQDISKAASATASATLPQDSTIISGVSSAGPTTNGSLNYTMDPTMQIPDEFIIAGGSLAAGAALYAKAKADAGAATNAPNTIDANNKLANIKQIKAELDADPSRKGLKNYGNRNDAEVALDKLVSDTSYGPPPPKGVEPAGNEIAKAREAALEALKEAEKPSTVAPRAKGPVSSIKDAPYSEPVNPADLAPKGKIEPQGDARKALLDAQKTLKRARPRL